jgi:DNA repair protein RecO (recombination protein O)
MNERTTGLILRTRPLTETSLIVHWLTPELGRLATVAKGARRPKSPFRGRLDAFYLADFSFARSRRGDLHTLREVNLLDLHTALRRDLDRLRQAAYGARLIEQTTEVETPLPVVFELLRRFLQSLPDHPAQPRTLFAFELKLLAELGLSPNFAPTAISAGSRQILHQLRETDWPGLSRLQLSTPQNREIAAFLHGFLIHHLGALPAGRVKALALEGSRRP